MKYDHASKGPNRMNRGKGVHSSGSFKWVLLLVWKSVLHSLRKIFRDDNHLTAFSPSTLHKPPINGKAPIFISEISTPIYYYWIRQYWYIKQVRFLLGVDLGTSLVVRRVRLCTSTTTGTGSIPGWGTKIQHEYIWLRRTGQQWLLTGTRSLGWWDRLRAVHLVYILQPTDLYTIKQWILWLQR